MTAKKEETPKVTRMLPVELSEPEISQRRQRLVTTLGEIETQEDHAAELRADAKAVMKDLVDTKDGLLKQIREKKETRAVDCEEREVFEQNAITIVRLDTGAVVEERPMSVEERQGDLDLGDDEKPEEN